MQLLPLQLDVLKEKIELNCEELIRNSESDSGKSTSIACMCGLLQKVHSQIDKTVLIGYASSRPQKNIGCDDMMTRLPGSRDTRCTLRGFHEL